MALRLKTVKYAFPTLNSVVNNTLTNFSQITIYLPESSKTFRKVWVEITADDIITATGGSMTTKTVNLRLGAAAYTSTTNSNTLTHSGENISWFTAREFTSHFASNWSGTSMTCDLQLQVNQSTGTTLGLVNVTAILYITYEYEDTSSSHLKTVLLPLNGPTGALPITTTTYDTIPALNTYLPEASKTYRSIFLVVHYNLNQADTTDHSVTFTIGSSSVTTQLYEASLVTDRFTRYVWSIGGSLDTSNPANFQASSSVANRCHCMQAYLVVTYEFAAASTTAVMNSVVLPFKIKGLLFGSVANKAVVNFWVQESNPVLNRMALYLYWNTTVNETSNNVRIINETTTTYSTVGSSVIAGSKCLMYRKDAPSGFTFQRGLNSIEIETSGASTVSSGGGFLILNYSSNVHPSGVGAHNHTVYFLVSTHGTGIAGNSQITSNVSVSIPETDYFISNLGLEGKYINNSTNSGGTLHINVEELSSEGSRGWVEALSSPALHDTEVGLNIIYSDCLSVFKQWPGSPKGLSLGTNRRFYMFGLQSYFFESLVALITYHSITYTVSGNISGSSGGTVNLQLCDSQSGDVLKTGSRVGDGSYSFVWFDNTRNICVVAKETATKRAVSKDGVPANDFDINLAGGSNVKVGGRIIIS